MDQQQAAWHCAGLDISLESPAICVVDDAGAACATAPAGLAALPVHSPTRGDAIRRMLKLP